MNKSQDEELKKAINKLYGGSLHIRHVDTGSCNGCDFEMGQLGSPVYDLAQYGVNFVASPRHADMLMVTGGCVRQLTKALYDTYEATPEPRLVVAVGACASSGGLFGSSYAGGGGVDRHIPVDVYIPGCPPSPDALIAGILKAIDREGDLK